MVGEATIKTGVRLVTVFTHKDVQSELSIKLNEGMTGTYNSKEGYEEFIGGANVIAFGPGMGNNDLTFEVLNNICNLYSGTLVIDADGINVLERKNPF
ncbi:NAD(P)H-hydrate dehydratase [Clostridium perfringens]|nr:NAD(P)H-hydrate dehydratase [Clostridium perfringens]